MDVQQFWWIKLGWFLYDYFLTFRPKIKASFQNGTKPLVGQEPPKEVPDEQIWHAFTEGSFPWNYHRRFIDILRHIKTDHFGGFQKYERIELEHTTTDCSERHGLEMLRLCDISVLLWICGFNMVISVGRTSTPKSIEDGMSRDLGNWTKWMPGVLGNLKFLNKEVLGASDLSWKCWAACWELIVWSFL